MENSSSLIQYVHRESAKTDERTQALLYNAPIVLTIWFTERGLAP